jgi:hypothetical protein
MTKRILTAIALLIVIAVPTSCGAAKEEAKEFKAERKKADAEFNAVDIKVEHRSGADIVDVTTGQFDTPRIIVWCAADGTTLWTVGEIVSHHPNTRDATAAGGSQTVTLNGCLEGKPRL